MRRLWTMVTILLVGVGVSAGADKKITVKIADEEYEALSKLAKDKKTDVEDLAEEAIREYIEARTSEQEKAKGEEKAGRDTGGMTTTAKSRSFQVTVADAQILQRVEASYDYSFQDGYKSKVIEAPKGMEYLVVRLELEAFTWKKVQSLAGDGMVPGCVLKWRYISLQDRKKRTYPCVLLGGARSKPWVSEGDREALLIKRDDGSIRMMRRTEGWKHWNDGRKVDLYFKVPQDAGPFKLSFMDVPDLDVVPE